MNTDQIAKIREALSQGACYLDPDPSIKTYHTAESLRAEFMECIALLAPDAKEGQAVGFVWTGASGQQYAELTPIPAETTKKVDYYLYRQPAAPAPEPEVEAREWAWIACRADREPVTGSDNWTVGEVGTYHVFFNLGWDASLRARLSPPSPKEVPRQLVMVLSGRYMHFEAVADTFRNYGYTVKE